MTLLKKRLRHKCCFLVNFARILRKPFRADDLQATTSELLYNKENHSDNECWLARSGLLRIDVPSSNTHGQLIQVQYQSSVKFLQRYFKLLLNGYFSNIPKNFNNSQNR